MVQHFNTETCTCSVIDEFYTSLFILYCHYRIVTSILTYRMITDRVHTLQQLLLLLLVFVLEVLILPLLLLVLILLILLH